MEVFCLSFCFGFVQFEKFQNLFLQIFQLFKILFVSWRLKNHLKKKNDFLKLELIT